MNNKQVAVRVRTEPDPPKTNMAAAMLKASAPPAGSLQMQTGKS